MAQDSNAERAIFKGGTSLSKAYKIGNLSLIHIWLIELDTLFCQKVVRGTYRLLPQLYQFIVILFGGACYIGNVVTFMIIYIPVIGKFCLMKCTFVDKSVSLQHLLRTFVVRITVGSDEADVYKRQELRCRKA